VSNDKWNNDPIQFMRLLSEIRGCQLTSEQYADLSASMDLSFDEIDEVLERASAAWEKYLEEDRLRQKAQE
jgi:hypothetical protein